MSACIAERLAMVSSRLSPLAVEERAMSRLITSADSRLAAISNVVRVRVEFSKNRLKTLLPRISGTFLTSRSLMPTKEEAVSRIWVTMALGRPSMVSRCCSSPFLFSCGLCMVYGEGKFAVVGALQDEALARGERKSVGDKVGGNRQFPLATVHQRGQHDARRAAVVEQLVDGCARGAAGVEHVV